MKKMMHYFKLFAVALLISFCACNTKGNAEHNDQPQWEIKRGVNISHWLSQNNRRATAPERYDNISEADIATIAQSGFDHIRLPIDEKELWTEEGEKIPYTFGLLHKAIEWCKKYDLRVLVDLHIIRSHYFNSEAENTLFTSEASQQVLLNLWKDLSEELISYPNHFLAYELMNEPVAPEHEQWNALVARLIGQVRQTEPERKIFVGSNRWQGVDFLQYLELPPNDPNLVISFHFYDPFLLTHYRASWVEPMRQVTAPINYPGRIISETDENQLSPELRRSIRSRLGTFDINFLENRILLAVQRGKELGLPVYCGEFGCIFNNVPTEVRENWYRDLITVFNKYDIPYTAWDYKGGFRVFNPDRTPANTVILDILTKQ
jgi:endoglucanase